jgi:hypothetical protein
METADPIRDNGIDLLVAYTPLGDSQAPMPADAEGVCLHSYNDYSPRPLVLTPAEAWTLPTNSGKRGSCRMCGSGCRELAAGEGGARRRALPHRHEGADGVPRQPRPRTQNSLPAGSARTTQETSP